MVVRIKVTLEQEEYSGLLKLALSEMRNPQEQLRFMLREELKRLGLLQENGNLSTKIHNGPKRKRKNKINNRLEKPAQSSNLENSKNGEHYA